MANTEAHYPNTSSSCGSTTISTPSSATTSSFASSSIGGSCPAPGSGGSKRFVLSLSLVKLEGRHGGATGGIECTVSAVLREERGGAIRAVLVGRAEADYDGDDAELGALEAAVRGAVASVPAAMR